MPKTKQARAKAYVFRRDVPQLTRLWLLKNRLGVDSRDPHFWMHLALAMRSSQPEFKEVGRPNSSEPPNEGDVRLVAAAEWMAWANNRAGRTGKDNPNTVRKAIGAIVRFLEKEGHLERWFDRNHHINRLMRARERMTNWQRNLFIDATSKIAMEGFGASNEKRDKNQLH